jgi:hypothetical protein
MNRKLERKKNKLLKRRQPKQEVIMPLPVPAIPSFLAPTQEDSRLPPDIATFLAELHRFASEYQQTCLRAAHRLMALGLHEGTNDRPSSTNPE